MVAMEMELRRVLFHWADFFCNMMIRYSVLVLAIDTHNRIDVDYLPSFRFLIFSIFQVLF